MAAARGISDFRMSLFFAVVVALATTMSVPVVGALLMFSLLVGPPAAARLFTPNPLRAIPLSIGFALVSVWVSIAAAYYDEPAGRILRDARQRRALWDRAAAGSRSVPVDRRAA